MATHFQQFGRRLALEQLQPRRLLAIALDNIPDMTIDEGDVASFTDVEFTDSTVSTNYSASVKWEPNSPDEPANVVAPTASNSQLRARISYQYDTDNFFSTAERRDALEFAINGVLSRLGDTLAGFASGGPNQVSVNFTHPTTGFPQTVPNFSIGNNELLFYVGSRELEDAIAEGGRGGHSSSGTTSFVQLVQTRGEVGAPQSDVAPWGGAITFDTDTNWFFGLDGSEIPNNESDFISVAMHETFHVLGFSAAAQSFSGFILNGRFVGPKATAEYDETGSPPLADDLSHWAMGVKDGGQGAIMTPGIGRGRRLLPTELDFAALDDIGWQIISGSDPGRVSDSHPYADSGDFEVSLTVRDSSDIANQTFMVTVNNVAPVITDLGASTGRPGEPVQITVDFTDPGADQHRLLIDWGDGQMTTETIFFGSRTTFANHTYNKEGDFTIAVTVADDDGGMGTSQQTVFVQQPRLDWHNPNNPLDVDDDGAVAPRDALIIINEVELHVYSDNAGILPPASGPVPFFFDTDGNDLVAPIDALLVINSLSSNQTIVAGSAGDPFAPRNSPPTSPYRGLPPASAVLIRSVGALTEWNPHFIDEIFADEGRG